MPSLTIACKCGHSVPFQDEDRGGEVYCTSCGAACFVPLEDAALGDAPRENLPQKSAAGAPARPSIFSSHGAVAAAGRIVGTVPCLCGTSIPVAAEQYGSSVYCPSCGAEVLVGGTLADRPALPTTPVAGPEVAAPTVRFRVFRSPVGLAALLVIFSGVAAVAYWVNQQPLNSLSLDVPVEEVAALPPPPYRPARPREFRPEDLTSEHIAGLAERDDPFAALQLADGWGTGLREHGVAAEDERYAQLAAAVATILAKRRDEMLERIDAAPKEPRPAETLAAVEGWERILVQQQVAAADPMMLALDRAIAALIELAEPIGLAEINGLLAAEDTWEALIQAEVWQETLRERGVAAKDPRTRRLVEVRRLLRRRMEPKPPPTPVHLAQFRELLKKLADRLAAKDLKQARAALEAAEQLLEAHADELGAYSRLFYELKKSLDDAELAIGGAQRLRELLTRAQQALGQDESVSEALECKARAKFLSRSTKMKAEEAKELVELVAALSPQLRLALGRRAVAEALSCQAAGDTAARNAQVRKAYQHLPGLPGAEVNPLLSQVQEWKQAAIAEAAEADGVKTDAASSAAGRQLALRDCYEAVLLALDDGAADGVLKAALDADKQLSRMTGDVDTWRERIGAVLGDVLEREVTSALSASNSKQDMAARLAAARQWLDRAGTWRDTPRIRALDGVLKQRGLEFAEQVFAEAQRVAVADRLEEAIRLAENAKTLGPPETAGRADAMIDAWQAEIARRSDREAEAKDWRRINAMAGDGEHALDQWQELEQFLKRYPQGARAADARKLQAVVRKRVAAVTVGQIARLQQLVREEKWRDAHRQLALLERVELSAEQRAALAEAREQLKQPSEQAKRVLLTLDRRARMMLTETDLALVRQVAGQALTLDPENADAKLLWKEVHRKITNKAEKLVQYARIYRKSNPEKYRAKLTEAARLDAEGPAGLKARELLAELN